MNILVVDDSKMTREILKSMLVGKFENVYFVDNGAQAVSFFQDTDLEVDLILLDLNMPLIDGKMFLNLNKVHKYTTAKIIIISSENNPFKIEEVLSLGADEYIIKPFDGDILFRKIKLMEELC